MNINAKTRRYGVIGAALAAVVLLSAESCGSADSEEAEDVDRQQSTYNNVQPLPFYDYSLTRDLLIKFYDAQNVEVTTFSYIRPQMGGAPAFECASQGYALPRDTQLSNPLQYTGSGGTIEQAEPNGTFTSKNTNQTVVFCFNDDGTVAPVLTEESVTIFPFPVTWEVTENYPEGHWVRVGTDSNISLELQTTAPAGAGESEDPDS